MTFPQLMGVAKRRCLVVLVILVCVSLATCLKDHEEEELILSQLADSITGDIDTEMVSNYAYDMNETNIFLCSLEQQIFVRISASSVLNLFALLKVYDLATLECYLDRLSAAIMFSFGDN